jgi:S-formylglutathione hydrolase FrmB
LSVFIPATNLTYRPRDAYVWVPPGWFALSQPKLPVIVMLHGTPGEPSDWTRAGFADSTARAFAEQNNGMAPILVVPDVNGSFADDTECVNGSRFGDVETYLTQDVPRFTQQQFNPSTSPGSMAVAGLSEGGTCAVMLALTNPKELPTLASYSGYASPTYQGDNAQQTTTDLFGGSQANYQAHDPTYLLVHQRFDGVAGWFESDLQDGDLVQAAQTLVSLATHAGVDTCLAEPPGTHSFGFWQAAFQHSLPWLSWRLKLTPKPQNLVARCVPGSS